VSLLIASSSGSPTARHALVLRVGPYCVRTSLRAAVVSVAMVVVLVLVSLVALGIGSFQVSVPDVVRALLGEGPEQVRTVVQWRLSRVVLAVLVGFGLGVSGAVMQSLTRNPLGSPDVIGFGTGAYTGALLAIVFVSASQAVTVPAALVGGMVTALLIYLLAYRRGVHGLRLIVVGIAVTAMLTAANGYLLLHTTLWRAQMAAIWGAGSINGLDWGDVRLVGITTLVALPFVLVLGRSLQQLELGDDAAAQLGVAVEPVRLALLLLSVALVAVSTAVAGPITFVALAAPHLARSVLRVSGVHLVPAGLTGAIVLLVCDVVGQHVLAPVILPVGLVTVVLGGAYLAWLLARGNRKERA